MKRLNDLPRVTQETCCEGRIRVPYSQACSLYYRMLVLKKKKL